MDGSTRITLDSCVRRGNRRTATDHKDGLMVGALGQATWPRPPGPEKARSRASRLSGTLAACVLCFAAAGCAGIEAHDARLRNAVEDDWQRIEASRRLNVSAETGAVLARQRLQVEAGKDPAGAARMLERRLQTESEPDGALALAELS